MLFMNWLKFGFSYFGFCFGLNNDVKNPIKFWVQLKHLSLNRDM